MIDKLEVGPHLAHVPHMDSKNFITYIYIYIKYNIIKKKGILARDFEPRISWMSWDFKNH